MKTSLKLTSTLTCFLLTFMSFTSHAQGLQCSSLLKQKSSISVFQSFLSDFRAKMIIEPNTAFKGVPRERRSRDEKVSSTDIPKDQRSIFTAKISSRKASKNFAVGQIDDVIQRASENSKNPKYLPDFRKNIDSAKKLLEVIEESIEAVYKEINNPLGNPPPFVRTEKHYGISLVSQGGIKMALSQDQKTLSNEDLSAAYFAYLSEVEAYVENLHVQIAELENL